MNQYIVFLFLLCSLFSLGFANAQSQFNFPNGFHKETFYFEIINNLFIVPVKINVTDFNFILDFGVNKTI